jgi:hypothetical protein
MKIVQIDDSDCPPVDVLPNGDGTFVDCKYWLNLDVGDQVQYLSEVGTSCYFVVDKQPTTTDGGFTEGVYQIVLRAAEAR